MKNSPSHSSLAGIATSLAILSAGCSGTQLFGEEKTCEQLATEYEKNLTDIDVMLSAAGAYVDMAAAGTPDVARSSSELREKIREKFGLADKQEIELKRDCANQFNNPSSKMELANVPRFAMLITGVRLRLQKLGNYLDSTPSKK
ncbi:MAG: hypothetical protein NTX63_04560 [Candidatus Peregrinibacteria bacterium]|nr:hypothetical protein [Candidatus Peregrinibacteria bacterium]